MKKIGIIFVFLIFFSIFSANSNISTEIKIKNNEINKIFEKYDLLIITPKEFLDEAKILKDHKEKFEIKTKIVEIKDIYNQIFWKGKDNPEKVKYFIKEAKENWKIKYVLLFGGRKGQEKNEDWWIPVRYSYLNRNYGNYSEGKYLSDLYFADIYDKHGNFSTWNDNNNSLFGEWKLNRSAEDIPDLYPDVFIGRLPCRNKIDAKNIVKKIIRYETRKTNDIWFKNFLTIAGDTYPKKTDYIDGENYTQQAIDIMNDFNAIKIWSSKGNLNWLRMIREINKGCGFVFFSGHGSAAFWTNHLPCSEKFTGYFRLTHMNFLLNRNKLPICLSGSGCFNNNFNASLGNTDWLYFKGIIPYNVPKCWGEKLTFKNSGGSIAVIASTGFSYESPDHDNKKGGCEWLDIHFFEEYKKSKSKILGEVWGNTINSFLENFSIDWKDTSDTGDAIIAKNVEQWLLIGDPSLKIGGYN